MRILNTVTLLIIGSLSLLAQDINPAEVTVLEGFTPEIPESEKIKETTEFKDTTEIDKSQNYSFVDKTVEVNYESRPLKAAKVSGEKLTDLPTSTIMLGGGSHFTSVSEISYNSLRKDNYSYGLTLNHFANRYQDGDFVLKKSLNQLNIFGKKIGEKNIFIANLDYDKRTSNVEEDFPGPSECPDCNLNKFSYSKFGVSVFSKELSEYKLKHHTTFFISDLNELSENQIHLSTELEKNIKGFPLSLELEFNDYINYANTDSLISRQKQDVKSIHISPSVSLQKFGIDIDIGLELHCQTDLLDSTEYEVFPQIKLSKYLVKNILYVEGGLRHNERRHTIKSLSDDNPYIHSFGTNQSWDLESFSTMDLRNSDIDEVYVSMRNVLGKDEVFTGSVAYGHIKNMQSFVMLSYSNLFDRFVSNYQDVWQLHADMDYKWRINDLIGVNANADYYNWGKDVVVSNRSNINAELGVSLNLEEKIKINASVSYLGKRTSLTQLPITFDGITCLPPFNSVDLNPQIHANISIDYNYTKSISAYLRINNILNSKEEMWQGYREIGVNTWFGLSYSF